MIGFSKIVKPLRTIVLSFLAVIALQAAGTDILCIYYPEWHIYPEGEKIFGAGRSEWDYVNTAKPKFKGHYQPIELEAGNPDDTNPQDVAKELKLAEDAGITAFVYDWYWADHHPIQHEALERGYLKTPVGSSKVKFALMWANHNRSDVFRTPPGFAAKHFFWTLKYTREEFLEAIDYMIEKYFKDERYYRCEGKLFLSIYSVPPLIKELGGEEPLRAMLNEARRKVASAGLGGLHLSAMAYDMGTAKKCEEAGFDSVSRYNINPYDFNDTEVGKVNGEKRQIFTHEEFANIHRPTNEKAASAVGIPYIYCVTRGWDCTPRCRQDIEFPFKEIVYPYNGVITDMKPALFGRIVKEALAWEAGRTKKSGMILINAWNEYTEGCYLMPDKRDGMGFLNALKEAVK